MITIYSKPNCTFCVQAEELCKSRKVDYEMLKLDEHYTREELIALCPVPVRSLPQIFIDGEYVGGFTELKAKL